MSRLTMTEIAKIAGVSPSTISRVLHDPVKVKEETRHRILQIVHQHGYVYNAAAGDLSRKRSSVIGLVAPIVQHVAFGYATLAVLKKAQEIGFSTIIGNTNFNPEEEKRVLQGFLGRKVGGVVLMGFSIGQEELVKDLIHQGIPCVVVWEVLSDPEISYVGFDNFEAARIMTEYLISLGHSRIGMIVSLYSKVGRIWKRLEGYKQALANHNIPFDPSLVIEREPSLIEGKEAMFQLLSRPDIPTAVFAASDYLAIGALAAAKQKGLKVPDQISIAGFDDIEFAAYCDPPLTTMRSPAYEMGEIAAKFIADLIIEDKQEVRRYQFDPELILRESCSPPRER